jgi:hypothetical protein
MSKKRKRPALPIDTSIVTPMTQAEFDWAWEQAPDWRVAELYAHPDAPIILGKPLDRAWRYVGKIGGKHMDYRVPCSCLSKKHIASGFNHADASGPIPRQKFPIAICPAGTIHVGKEHFIYYVGMCEECHVVYWLTEEKG